MSQTTDILEHMKREPITAIEALTQYGCFRLAARIKDLREDGHEIETTTLELPNGKSIAKYSLKETEAA